MADIITVFGDYKPHVLEKFVLDSVQVLIYTSQFDLYINYILNYIAYII